ncbi:hypothetical protein LSUE1_G008755 [Lachnellula suecica]|uniref:Uncharacterized protein n=1 Tax=Lachnellula suecica TaxID=602035 RepID=A0A8T9BT08_9HELO|nr:hypothetical protein LSUE1_G008755 [Lachnellula suecica]
MSKHLRQKAPVTPVQKKSKRKAASVTSSSDNDYNYDDIDGISDSDGDEKDVMEAEGQAIMADVDVSYESPLPDTADYYAEWNGFADEDPPFSIVEDNGFFNDHMARGHEPDLATEAAAWNAIQGDGSDDSESTVTRPRVRFDLSSDDESDLEEHYPDIFLDQNSLNPVFRQQIEEDDEGHVSSDGGHWEYSDDEQSAPHADEDEADSDSDSDTYSSGYDSDDDEGDTTDEDIPIESINNPDSALQRSPVAVNSDDSDSSEAEEIPRRPIRISRPKLGIWKHDRRDPKTICMYDEKVNKVLFFRAPRRSSTFSDRAPPRFNTPLNGLQPPMEDLSPMLSNSANLMMSGMMNGLSSLEEWGGRAVGPPEAFYPFTYVSNDGVIEEGTVSSNEMDDDEFDIDDEENLWKIDDMVDFGAGSSSAEDEDPSPSSDTAEPFSTPARPTALSSEDQVHPLLNHFKNSSVVGAFRNNQRHHVAMTRGDQSRDSLAFSGPLNQGTLKGIKGGRFVHANKPITPRRKTLQQPIGSSPGSPLASMKRKFGEEDFRGHKRHRSAF